MLQDRSSIQYTYTYKRQETDEGAGDIGDDITASPQMNAEIKPQLVMPWDYYTTSFDDRCKQQ